MSVLTKKQVTEEIKQSEEESLFCGYCYHVMGRIGKLLYCPNDMCLNDNQYTVNGGVVDD